MAWKSTKRLNRPMRKAETPQPAMLPARRYLAFILTDEARHIGITEHRREAARSQGQPREGGAISHHLLGEEGKEDERAEQGDKGEEDDYVANGEGTVAEDPQVYHRVVGTKLDDDEKGQRQRPR